MKHKIGSILVVIAIILAVFATTFAWFTWQLSQEDRIGVNVATGGLDADCINYSTSNVGDSVLIPTSTKEQGYITNININQTCGGSLYTNFKLTLTTFPITLKHSTFIYEFYKGSTKISEGNFANFLEGDEFYLAENQIITNVASTYTLYLWIDGNQDNPNTMQNQTYEFDLVAIGTDEVPA